jgi:hypothetical protein
MSQNTWTSRASERDLLRVPARILAEVEPLDRRHAEHVVEDRVLVREVDGRAHDARQHALGERLVALRQHAARGIVDQQRLGPGGDLLDVHDGVGGEAVRHLVTARAARRAPG